MPLLRARYIPNAICIMRMLLVVPIVMLLLEQRYLHALVLIVIAGLSDGLDGFLARRYNWATRIGGLLDPLADKLLLVSVFASLAWVGHVPGWLFLVVVGRDLTIVSGGIAYEYLIGRVEPHPSRVGKLNTVVALVYLFLVMTGQVFGWPAAVAVVTAGALVFVVSIVSGLDYVLTWSRLARAARQTA